MSDPQLEVETALDTDESIVWIGQPQEQRFTGEKWGEVAFGMLLGLVALAAAGGIALVLRFVGDWTVLFLIPVPLVFGWYALHYLRASSRYRQILSRAIYAVTNHRAIVLNGFGYSRRMNLEAIDDVQTFTLPITSAAITVRNCRNGIGDVVLGGEKRGSGRHSARYVEFGFFGIEDPSGIVKFIK